MAAILDFTHNAMYNVIADHTTRSGIPENPIVDTKIMKLLLFCRKLWQFKVWPSPNGGHFEFLQFSSSWYPADMHYRSHEGVESIEKKTLTAGAGYSLMAAWLYVCLTSLLQHKSLRNANHYTLPFNILYII